MKTCERGPVITKATAAVYPSRPRFPSEGELCFRAPDGKQLPAVPAREAAGDALNFLHEWADERGLDLGADRNTPLWDGTRPDYDWAVAALAGVGG